MANTGNIQHTLKTGADEALYLTPLSNGKLDASKVIKSRMTGESIQGAIETLDSNELKAGRTPSKKKLGNESSEGSLDFEFSPDTFDMLLESAFRGRFTAYTGNSIVCQVTDGEHNDFNETGVTKTLLGENGLLNLTAGNYTVKKLEIGTDDLEFDILRKLGGATGDDLWQRYHKMNVNTFDINVATNSIVTGSFGFMGINSPLRVDDAAIKSEYGGASTSQFVDDAKSGNTFIETVLPATQATDTDQFVSTCGNLWINGQNITWSENVSISLNNNLERKNAIMVKRAIATTANRLDITGNYQSYVVKGKSEPVYNDAVKNNTVEIMFLLQDKEDDPDNIYLFQIRHASFDAPSSSNNGTDSYEDNLSYSSFDEDPVAIYKIQKTSTASIANVTNLNYNASQQKLTWTAVTDSTGIIVDVYDRDGILQDKQTLSGSVTNYTITAPLVVKSGWKMVVTNKMSAGLASGVSITVPVPEVTNLSAVKSTKTISWNQPSDSVGILVEVYDADDNLIESPYFSGTKASYVASALDTDYRVVVKNKSVVGFSDGAEVTVS